MQDPAKPPAYLLCLLLLLTAQARGEVALLKSVSYDQEGEAARVILRLDRAVKYKAGVLKGPDRIWIDLIDSIEYRQASPTLPGNAVVERIRIGHPEKDVTRIV